MGVFDCHLKAGFWLTAPGGGICVLTSSFQINCVVPKCFCFSLFFFFLLFLYFFTILFANSKKNQKKKKGCSYNYNTLGGKERKKKGRTNRHTYVL